MVSTEVERKTSFCGIASSSLPVLSTALLAVRLKERNSEKYKNTSDPIIAVIALGIVFFMDFLFMGVKIFSFVDTNEKDQLINTSNNQILTKLINYITFLINYTRLDSLQRSCRDCMQAVNPLFQRLF